MPDLHQPFSRRLFIRQGLMLASLAATVPHFIQQSAMGMLAPAGQEGRSRPGVPEDRILVVVQLSGGNDGLNTVVPYGSAAYYAARPGISIGEPGNPRNNAQALQLSQAQGVGLHPNLMGLKELYDEGQLCIVQGVGYPNPNRSHFASMDIWQTGETSGSGTGWLGRYVDAACNGSPAADMAVSIGRSAPIAMIGDVSRPVTFETPDLFRWMGQDMHAGIGEPYQQVLRAGPLDGVPEGTQASFLMRTALDAQVTSDRIREAVARSALVDYPRHALAQQLRTIAAMIRSGMKTRVYYASMGGFDTHAGQSGTHANLMRQLGDSLRAFQKDLNAQGNQDRVLTMCFSEFGRRVRQNGSNGTDHGTAGPVFVLGARVRPGLASPHPSLEDLDAGDLKYGVDFRAVYQELLGNWMGAPTRRVLGGEYRGPRIVRT